MRKLILCAFAATFILSIDVAHANDEIMGKEAVKAFKLTPSEIQSLREAGDLGGAFIIWKQIENRRSQDEISEKVFETLIIPQID